MSDSSFTQILGDRLSKIVSNKSTQYVILGVGSVLGLTGVAVGLVGLAYVTGAEVSSPVVGTATQDLGKVLVEVAGAVNQPGIYTLDFQSRVATALELAGGMHADADQLYLHQQLNLAEKVSDGQKIYLPFKEERSSASSLGTGSTIESVTLNGDSTKLNLNTASQKDLESLPGIGEKLAQQIIAARPISNAAELITAKVLTQKVADELQNLIQF